MAELNDVDINSAPAQSVETMPSTEMELQERQSISSDTLSNTSGNQEAVSQGNEGGSEAPDSVILPLNETNCSSDDQSEVESCILKGRSYDLLK